MKSVMGDKGFKAKLPTSAQAKESACPDVPSFGFQMRTLLWNLMSLQPVNLDY